MPELGAASGGQMPAVGMFYGGTYNQLMEEFVRLQQLGQLPSGVTNFQQYLQYLSDQASGDGDDDGDPEEPQNEFTEEFYPDLDPDTFDIQAKQRALNEARRGGHSVGTGRVCLRDITTEENSLDSNICQTQVRTKLKTAVLLKPPGVLAGLVMWVILAL